MNSNKTHILSHCNVKLQSRYGQKWFGQKPPRYGQKPPRIAMSSYSPGMDRNADNRGVVLVSALYLSKCHMHLLGGRMLDRSSVINVLNLAIR